MLDFSSKFDSVVDITNSWKCLDWESNNIYRTKIKTPTKKSVQLHTCTKTSGY